MDDHADVVVLGMGPGGEEVAGKLAEAGLDERADRLAEAVDEWLGFEAH